MAYPGASTPIVNPTVPVCVPVEGGMSHGKMILIQGNCPHGSDSMSINLQSSYSMQEPRPDTGLHFNVRFNEHCVVRNTLIAGSWGSEERHGGMPFRLGQPFEIIILVENHAYKIAVNGKHFIEFHHRLGIERCGYLRIEGNVRLSFIKFQGGATPLPPAGQFVGGGAPPGGAFPQPGGAFPQPGGAFPQPGGAFPQPGGAFPQPGGAFPQPGGGFPAPAGGPIYNPPVPFQTQIPGGVRRGKMIFISGIPHPSASRFSFNIQQGTYSNNDIGLHFDVRLHYGDSHSVVVRNHRQNGGWGSEERHQTHFPFAPNGQFDIIILVEQGAYKVAVNNQHFIEFHHRIRPIHKMDTLDVAGDVRLTQVRFQ